MIQATHHIPSQPGNSEALEQLQVSFTSMPFQTVLEPDPFADIYAARDRNGDLWIYNFKTTKCPEEDDTGMWCLDEDENGHKGAQLPGWMYPYTQWRDDEPTLIMKGIKEVGHA